jgi:hypothetical protein
VWVIQWGNVSPWLVSAMHYGRFCREIGRWVKIEAEQTPPVVSPEMATEIPVPAPTTALPEANLVPIDEARIVNDANRETARKNEATPP